MHFLVTWCGKEAKLQDLEFWTSGDCLWVPYKLWNVNGLVRLIWNWNNRPLFSWGRNSHWREVQKNDTLVSVFKACKFPPAISVASRFVPMRLFDFFLWGYLKDQVNRELLENITDLKAKLRHAIASITKETLQKLFGNIENGLLFVIRQNGDNFKTLLTLFKLMIISFNLHFKALKLNYFRLRYEYFKSIHFFKTLY